MTNENTATTDVATAAYDAAPATADQAAQAAGPHDAGPQPTTGTAPEPQPAGAHEDRPHDAGPQATGAQAAEPQGPEPQASGILRTAGAHAPVLDEATVSRRQNPLRRRRPGSRIVGP